MYQYVYIHINIYIHRSTYRLQLGILPTPQSSFVRPTALPASLRSTPNTQIRVKKPLYTSEGTHPRDLEKITIKETYSPDQLLSPLPQIPKHVHALYKHQPPFKHQQATHNRDTQKSPIKESYSNTQKSPIIESCLSDSPSCPTFLRRWNAGEGGWGAVGQSKSSIVCW